MIQTIALKDKTGFSLVEVMLALVVSLFVFLAVMQTALVSIDSNMINVLRDEAVNIASMRMNEARNVAFDTLSDDDTSDALLTSADCYGDFSVTLGSDGIAFANRGALIQRNIKNVASFGFCTNRNITALDTDNQQIDITVVWTWKNEPYNHSITSFRRRPGS